MDDRERRPVERPGDRAALATEGIDHVAGVEHLEELGQTHGGPDLGVEAALDVERALAVRRVAGIEGGGWIALLQVIDDLG